jgi:hypothetical protein
MKAKPAILSLALACVIPLLAEPAKKPDANKEKDAPPPPAATEADRRDLRIQVDFRDPDAYTDCKDDYVPTKEEQIRILGDLQRELRKHATLYLKEGERLQVVFNDIDLAGEIEPIRNGEGKRVLRDITPPRLEIEFKIVGPDGAVKAEGKRSLKKLGYLTTFNLNRTEERYYHDKKLIREWVEKEIGQRN